MQEKMLQMVMGMFGITSADITQGIAAAKQQWDEFQARMKRLEDMNVELQHQNRLMLEIVQRLERAARPESEKQAPR